MGLPPYFFYFFLLLYKEIEKEGRGTSEAGDGLHGGQAGLLQHPLHQGRAISHDLQREEIFQIICAAGFTGKTFARRRLPSALYIFSNLKYHKCIQKSAIHS